jgi:hypothetical protein
MTLQAAPPNESWVGVFFFDRKECFHDPTLVWFPVGLARCTLSESEQKRLDP